jgi:hypothetical protein
LGQPSPGYATWKRYFGSPEQCDRDRDLFVKYIPILRRLNEAGWEPVTCARAGPEGILIERFGAWGARGLYFTVRNSGDAPQRARLAVDLTGLGLSQRDLGRLAMAEIVSRQPLELAGQIARGVAVLELPLEAFQTAVVHLAPAK